MKWVNIPNDPANITGGYLLELEFNLRYGDEVSGFITPRQQYVVLKSPEYASEAEVQYIAGLYCEGEEALFSETGYNSLGKHYSEYFDVDASLRTYLFLELSKSIDAAYSSFYFYKDADSDLLVAAPVWDFDRAFYSEVDDHRCDSRIQDPNGWHANSYSYTNYTNYNTETVLTGLFRHEEARAAAAALWNECVLGAQPEDVTGLFNSLYEENAGSCQMNLVRWYYDSVASAPAAAASAADRSFSRVSDFLSTRMAALDGAFNGDLAMLYYDANGSTGHVFNREIAFVGDAVTAVERQVLDAYIDIPSGYLFCGWNTQPDGMGNTYMPGDAVPQTKKTTTLYAVWKTQAQLDAEQQLAIDLAAANAVQTAINDIGAVTYSDESKAKIDAARAAYDALTDAQKALVENYDALTAAEASYAEQQAAVDLCPWDNVDHGASVFGRLTRFFHNILFLFARLLGRR